MPTSKHLVAESLRFQLNKASKDADFFSRHIAGQKPHTLIISCSDSRVNVSWVSRSGLGQLFESQNVANRAADDDQTMAIVEYALGNLPIENIIVCGHDGCGGVAAAMQQAKDGLPDNASALQRWIEPIAQVYREHASELSALDDDARYRRMVDLNVHAQVTQLSNLAVVSQALKNDAHTLRHVSGVVYDMRGRLFALDDDGQRLMGEPAIESAIASQINRLTRYSESYNPFKFFGAAAKAARITGAYQAAVSQKVSLRAELANPGSLLSMALNQHRLGFFSLFNSQGPSSKAASLLQVEQSMTPAVSA